MQALSMMINLDLVETDPNDKSDKACVTAPMVMKSAAGYYVGTTYLHIAGPMKGFPEPNERLGGYHRTAEEAAEEWKFHIDGEDLSGYEAYDDSIDYAQRLHERNQAKGLSRPHPQAGSFECSM